VVDRPKTKPPSEDPVVVSVDTPEHVTVDMAKSGKQLTSSQINFNQNTKRMFSFRKLLQKTGYADPKQQSSDLSNKQKPEKWKRMLRSRTRRSQLRKDAYLRKFLNDPKHPPQQL
jgi:hypothetical protein